MIFLTGATGLVGSFICRKLVQEGFQVRALKRSGSDTSRLHDIRDRIEWVEGDLLDIISLNQALEDCSRVIHCAAVVSYHKGDKKLLQKVNVEGTANLANAALKQNIERFVFMSSVAAVGRSSKLSQVDETFKWTDADEHSAYGLSKHEAELEVFRAGVEGMEVVLLNPALVLGPAPLEQSSAQVFKYVMDEKPFYTEGCMNFVDVRDLATITLAALEGKLKAGERYIVSAGSTSYKTFFDLTASCLNKKAPSIRVNPYLLKTAYYFELLRARLSGKAPLISRETLKLAQQQLKFSNSKVRQALDYQFIPLEESVQWTCRQIQS